MMDMKVAPVPEAAAGAAVHYLEDLLEEVIRYLDGEEAAALVQRARDVARQDDEEALEALFSTLRPDQAVYLARAFTCASMLSNLGEDVVGRRRSVEAEMEPGALPHTLVDAAQRLGPKVAGRIVPRMVVAPVLTAHPTEVRRRAVVEREAEIARLMSLRTHHLLPHVEKRLREDLFREVALLWKARMHRPERISPADEIRNSLAIVRRSILPALADLYDGWSEHFESATPLTLGSWLGGDRDGHPGVTGDTLRLAMRSQARLILNHYSDEVRRLWFDLAVSVDLTPASPGVLALAEASPHAGKDDAHRKDEPYRLALQEIWDRLSATANRLAGGAWPTGSPAYEAAADFVADLETIRQSIRTNLGERVVGGRLRTLVAVARACGFHLLSIDLRQNADVHERMIHELYVRAGVNIDYLGSDETERVRVLSKELSHDRPLRSPFLDYSEETMRELGVLDAAAEVVRLYGEKALGACIISKTATLSDVLEPLVLLKQAGLVQGGDKGRSAIRISPLLETIGDLEHGPELLRQWLALPLPPALFGEPKWREIMLGYSDSNKDGGYVASRHNVSKAAALLAAQAREQGVDLWFFHGRGGSVGRGGGPAAQAVMAQPPGTVKGRLRLTEQGEMISRRFGDQPTARRNLDSLAAAVLMASARPDEVQAGSGMLDTLSQASFTAYRELVYDNPAFEDFFWGATPIAELVGLNIGSRPASRTPSRRIEDLRAIPWVFSWSQARFMLPAWYGFAGGAAKAGLTADDLRSLAEEQVFATLVSNMEVALAQSDMAIAAKYAALHAGTAGKAIFGRIRDEHEAACELVLAIRGGSSLLDNHPQMAESVALAAEVVDPLNHLQLELLARRRAGDEDPQLKLAIQLTVAGIASGLRNTG
ncbi:MAG: phosphoenolpyruvate carboxylase [Phenylobacterium sp.]|uniref:phosphoenolpyruvate carboxylase n=1 Tax=Phenylobacterium sp. TaxID=1871053 RepID=UPI001202B7DA|nr:phosphoenolpyruvate carboxylase [Phenylobacterium sp.]TAJ69680.1 MAG: phosphoenolpyruvate carboxylase [Phenylobacterium sp.]